MNNLGEENWMPARLNALGRGRIQKITTVRELQRPNIPMEMEPKFQSATTVKTEVTHSDITSLSNPSEPSPRYWTAEKQDEILNAANIKPSKVIKTIMPLPKMPRTGIIVSRPDICTDKKRPGHTSYKGYEKSYLQDLLAKEQDKDQLKIHEEVW